MKTIKKFEIAYIAFLLIILLMTIISNYFLNISEETVCIALVSVLFIILLMLGFVEPHVINEAMYKEYITSGKYDDAPYYYFVKEISESKEMKRLYCVKVLFNPMIYIIGSLAVFIYRLSLGQSSDLVLANNILRTCCIIAILLSICLHIYTKGEIMAYVNKKHNEFFFQRFGLVNAKGDVNIKKYTDELYNKTIEAYELKYGSVKDETKITGDEVKTADESIYVFSCAYSFSIPYRRNSLRNFEMIVIAYNNYMDLFSKTNQNKKLEEILKKYNFLETMDGKTLLVKIPVFVFRKSGRYKYFRACLMDYFKHSEELYQMTRFE